MYASNFSKADEIEPAGLEVQVRRNYYWLQPASTNLHLPDRNANVVDTKEDGFQRVLLKSGDSLPAGAAVEVELLVDSKNDYEYLLIEDPKPAGFEAVDSASGYMPASGLSVYRELRDQHVGMCVQTLPHGSFSIRYQLRTETPGDFHVMPTSIIGMYAPELVGNSANWTSTISATED